MKPYGQKTKDHGCCPGHDKFSREKYSGRRTVKARARGKQIMHGIARARARREIHRTLQEMGS
jgi:hypothetical protein